MTFQTDFLFLLYCLVGSHRVNIDKAYTTLLVDSNSQTAHFVCFTGQRRPWSQSEKAAVKEKLGVFIRIKKVPGKKDCEAAKDDTRLCNREWKDIKYCVKNLIASKNH